MTHKIPDETIQTFARTIYQEAQDYGFGQIDIVRLINALMDLSADEVPATEQNDINVHSLIDGKDLNVDDFPLTSKRIKIRRADQSDDVRLLQTWMQDDYGKHFLLSCATAQRMDVSALLANTANEIGIVLLGDNTPVGAVAFLDIDQDQRRAELRKLIGVSDARGKGLAEEATTLWIRYGCERLELEKFYVSTLQTHLRNVRLNESIGFRVEGILQNEVRIGAKRYDVLRMGLSAKDFLPLSSAR